MEARPVGRDGDEQGYSMVELMVVVLIIAILIAIAIPTFLGARQTANDRATQANVRNAFTATRVYYNGNLKYTDVPSEMQAVEPSLAWTVSPLADGSVDRAVQINVYDTPSARQTVVVVGRTRTGRCFYLRDVMGGASSGTYYDRSVPNSADCPDVDPATITRGSWSS